MAETKREIERKYEGSSAAAEGTNLPDLTKVAGVSAVVDEGVAELDATYYDTADLRLAAASRTLRRRTGGDDAGWHLKLPVATGVRDEIRAPLSDTVPRTLAGLVRAVVREAELVPVVRLISSRDVRHLVDADGALLAELSVDAVRAERLTDGGGTSEWTEIEVELADGGDPALLDKVEKKLLKAGLRPSAWASKLARALADTAPEGTEAAADESGTKSGSKAKAKAEAKDKAKDDGPPTAGDHVLAYLRTQRDALVELDPAARRDLPDSVHQMRVATRRMRSAFRSYRKVIDRAVTDPIGDELKWLAAELGVDRDREVLTERIQQGLTELPRTLISGPVRGRLRTWSAARRSGSRRHLVAVLDSKRYLALLDTLDALLDAPPLRPAAAKPPAAVIAKAVLRDYKRLSAHVQEALDAPPATEARDLAMHEARKKAKRTRYAAEAATPALGKPAKRLVRYMKDLQNLLGEHQDSVMVRGALRDLAAQAHAAGESSFTYGVLYGREEHKAAAYEDQLPAKSPGQHPSYAADLRAG
ncbi:CYTH and CHAD domain-containing protein [Streptomyces apocyni]|uniref:CYTH and CHAD domain-containing protein n=1 Tax=Streptomyces apocyni TaxID=2654677 RepID=UPI0012E99496|nr:CYTH and CHAD domain-containing protein [Streptomyces apocyni]